jgi:hypothetical protein
VADADSQARMSPRFACECAPPVSPPRACVTGRTAGRKRVGGVGASVRRVGCECAVVRTGALPSDAGGPPDASCSHFPPLSLFFLTR